MVAVQDLKFLFFILVILFVILVVVVAASIQRRPQREPEKLTRMRELRIPGDESRQAILLTLFQKEGIKYHQPEFPRGPYAWTQLPSSYLLVSEEYYDRAVEIVENFHKGRVDL